MIDHDIEDIQNVPHAPRDTDERISTITSHPVIDSLLREAQRHIDAAQELSTDAQLKMLRILILKGIPTSLVSAAGFTWNAHEDNRTNMLMLGTGALLFVLFGGMIEREKTERRGMIADRSLALSVAEAYVDAALSVRGNLSPENN